MATRKKAAMKDTLKRFTNFILFDYLPKELESEDITFTATDVDYDEDFNTVSFKVAEAPGWLFGIWYTIEGEPCDAEGKVIQTLKYSVFGQHERFIDKFKPSHSSFCEEGSICDITPDYEFLSRDINCVLESMFTYIINEPALAFCRDVHCWDYNYAYHTREEAEQKMAETIEHEDQRQAFILYARDALLNYVKEFVREHWKNEKVFIHDFGEHISPRYEVTFLYDDFEEDTRPIHERIHGIHYLDYIESQENDPSDHPKDIQLYQFFLGYHELRTRLEQEADEYNFYWWPEVSTFFTFQTMSHYEAWKRRVKDRTGKDIEDELIYC
jgi:hypothetical protein